MEKSNFFLLGKLDVDREERRWQMVSKYSYLLYVIIRIELIFTLHLRPSYLHLHVQLQHLAYQRSTK
jgi:hypothetical protein